MSDNMTTHKINIAELESKLNGQTEYSPYRLEINGSVDTFLKIRETLTRIGRIQESKDKVTSLYQVAHVVQDESTNQYYLVHFKHMYMMYTPQNKTELNEQDFDQMTYIASLLEKWGFCTLDESIKEVNPRCNITIIPFSRKKEVVLRRKFNPKKHVV